MRAFYRTRLEAGGFVVDELVVPNLNPMTAAYLSLDGGLVAKRVASDDILTLQIRTDEGFPDPLASAAPQLAQDLGMGGRPTGVVPPSGTRADTLL